MQNNLNIAFFASHGGSNMQAIIDAIKDGRLNANAACVISNNSNSGALQRARSENIPAYHISTKTHPIDELRIQRMIEIFIEHNINIIVLAGYMKKLPTEIIEFVGGRVLNIHPALLPKHGGEGMYGINVHKSVIETKDKITGATVHLVDSEYDRGKILQQISIDVLPDDTAESLAERVLAVEHIIYTDTLAKIANGDIII